MGNGALPHGPSYRAYPRLSLTSKSDVRSNVGYWETSGIVARDPNPPSKCADAAEQKVGQGGHPDGARRGPPSAALDVLKWQVLGIHAEEAGDQRRRQQEGGKDRQR